jgi:GTP-binding protein
MIPMLVREVAFLKSALDPRDYPRDGRPEIAFLGRSNVGKSSLLNTLVQRKNLAKTSATPGKTQTLNFFDLNGKIYLVDLPGYGYAKVPIALKKQWNERMTEYLRTRKPLRLAVALVDARHAPTDNDHEIQDLLHEAALPTLLVATKIDKLKRGERGPALDRIRDAFGLDQDAIVVPFSSVTREGVREVWRVIEEALAAPPPRV